MICFGAIGLLTGESNSAALPSSVADYWTRLNYGLVATKVKKVCIADGYVSHMFHIPLPKEEFGYGPRSTNSSVLECDHLCFRMKAIPEAIQSLRESTTGSIATMIRQVYQLIPDLDSDRPQRRRQRKGLLDFIGQTSQFLFGTAQLSDVCLFVCLMLNGTSAPVGPLVPR